MQTVETFAMGIQIVHGTKMRRVEVMASEVENTGRANVTPPYLLAISNKEIEEVSIASAHDPVCWTGRRR